MELSKAFLTAPVAGPDVLPNIDGIEAAPDKKKQQIAKQFESLFLNRILEQMNNTAELFDGEDKAAAGQVRGIFNMYMSQHISDSGGFGLWKDIYKSLTQMQQQNESTNSINEQI